MRTLQRFTTVFALALGLALAAPAPAAQVLALGAPAAAPQPADGPEIPDVFSADYIRGQIVKQVQNWAAVINRQLYEYYENRYESWKLNRGKPSEFERPQPPLLWEHWVTGDPFNAGVRERTDRAAAIVEELPPAPRVTVCVGPKIRGAATWYSVCAPDNAPPGTSGKAPDGQHVMKILIPFIGSSFSAVYEAR